MLISKRIKWLSLQYLVLLSLSKSVLGQGEGGGDAINAATTNEANPDGSCEPITGYALKQFKVDSSSEVTISNNSVGVLYNCVAGTVATGPSTYIQIKEGYFMISEKQFLFLCTAGTCKASSTPKKGYYLPSTTADTTNKLYSYVGDSPSLKALTNANDGYYLSGEDFENNKYNDLIKCSSNTCSKLEGPSKSSYYVSGEDFDTTGSYYKKLINCNESGKCTIVVEPTVLGFYTNGDGKTDTEVKKLIDCSTANQCKEVYEQKNGYYLHVQKPTGEGHYLDASGIDAGGKYSKLILCEHDDSKKCEFAAVAAERMTEEEGNYYFLGGKDTSKVIKCTYGDDGNKCEEVDGEKKAGYGYIDFGTSGNIIACTEGTCKSLNKGNAQVAADSILAQNIGFLDANEGEDASKNIIICFNSDDVCTSTLIDGVQRHAFLDGTSYDSNSKIFKNVIKCMESGGCTPLESVPLYSTAEVYIDAGSSESEN
ncbi:hypothetical protein BCR36DRAFT_374637 [Piromyces finnis]|uniref:Scaffoldin n=1 Tax=Piromyces finnis TaxID=1754191 RepID=A0A1Y1UW10_9FUNG|nr:hypothetical protein BCR36DRAFT_374637 [Piromyces finnis]|eukprot:ORX42262.1 hypothetical protein BCR36DRAFT_374637 [Piromyces finnis]